VSAPRPPRRAAGSTWVLGAVAVLGIAYVTLTTARTDAPGSGGVPSGRPLPAFAAPLASSTRRCEGRECNPNVAPRAGQGARRAACGVRLPDVLNSCALAERGPVALAFLASRSGRCEEQVDVMQRLLARFPRVQFAAVSVRGDRAALRRAIRERGWTLPVGHDANGAVASLYGVAVCPTITFARAGGRVADTSLDFLDEDALAVRLRAIGG
jgi:AhpC/TSA family